jgi:AraC-like DNA-binding protein
MVLPGRRNTRERSTLTEIRSQILPLLIAAVRARGHRVDDLCQRYRLGADASTQREVAVPLAVFRDACDELAVRSADPFLGVGVAARLPRGAYGLPEFVFRSAPTTREAVIALVRYARLINNLLVFALDEAAERAIVSLRIPDEPSCLGRQANEFAMAILFSIGRELTKGAWKPETVWFAHEAPKQRGPLEAVFGTTHLEFAAGFNAIAFDPAMLNFRVPTSDDALYAVLDAQAKQAVASIGTSDELEPIREKIRHLLPTGEPSIEQLASMLHVTVRSLQRRFAERGTTFRALTEDVRKMLARLYLDDHQRPVTEVAFLLGYSDVRPFIRAFKRWTGKTPGASRGRAT